VHAWPERVWAVEGSNGAGRPLAQRLLADRQQVLDVPAKLSARARVLDTGLGRKTDAHHAHSVAVIAVRTAGLRVLSYDEQLEALRMLADRREELTRARVRTVNRLHRILSEAVPGKSKKDLTALQAKRILAWGCQMVCVSGEADVEGVHHEQDRARDHERAGAGLRPARAASTAGGAA
jgi:hypothetical protein